MRKNFALISIVFALSACKREGPVEMKSVTSRGGQVRFQIPKHWIEEPERNGNLYYDPAAGSGSLRLSVLTFTSESETVGPSPYLKDQAKKLRCKIESLPNGCAGIEYSVSTSERGETFSQQCWVMEKWVRNHLIIALFTYTDSEGPNAQQNDRALLEKLEPEIRNAEFRDQ